MMLILLFTLLCAAGVGMLFWQLRNSDGTTANKLRTRLAEEADSPPPAPEA